ncbi:MAG: ATP-binding protein [Candidatus Eremiobacteraeota bacterium]|nr:ATP-binding protein [Candidatus Eremiobacteraeota bacterium]
MDPIKNPFSPNAGAPPPALIGRDALIESFSVAARRIQAGRSQKSMLPTGLRGVGKTVLLNRFVDEARGLGYVVAQLEASESETFLETVATEIRNALYSLSSSAKVRGALNRALGVLKGFTLTLGLTDLSLKLGVDTLPGKGDSGILSSDLTALFVAVGEAAREENSAVLIAIDELQYLNEEQLAAIIMAVHRVAQLGLPLLVIGTGLPQLPALAGNAKSYAERLFDYPSVGPLSRLEVFEAIRGPADAEGVAITDTALDRLHTITEGYPYFIQEWAYRVWNIALRSPISIDDVSAAEPEVLARLDESFFRVRYDRLTPREKQYLRAMAELGPGPHRSGDIANILGVKVESSSPLRSGLIKKGMIYSPQHGDTAFTVPLFDAFMRRTMPLRAT